MREGRKSEEGKGFGRVRRADLLLGGLAAGLFLFGLLFLDQWLRGRSLQEETACRARTVKELMLTDLCLFTEARYTRHLSQADLYSAFQDHPTSIEHFPAGSLAGPPKGIGALHEKMD